MIYFKQQNQRKVQKMDKIKKLLSIRDNTLNTKYFILLVLLAYIFSVAIRYIWVYQFGGIPQFMWNHQLMINTNDGYYWAEGARDILAGFHQPHDLSPVYAPISKLTALLVKILPFSFETIILWMPSFIGSLLVIPIMLIARVFKLDILGFCAALLGGVAWSYYNRTMTGYYDTDMLTIVFPTFLLWSIIASMVENRYRYLLFIPVFIILYSWWYGSSYSLNMAMIFIVFLYVLVFERKNNLGYEIIIFMLISIMPTFWWLKIGILFLLLLAFYFKKETLSKTIIFAILGLSLIVVFFMGGLDPVVAQFKAYVLRDTYASGVVNNFQLHYFAVNKTVREAGRIPFTIFADRISGSTVTFILAVIGYLLLSLRYKAMWLALPMVGLGFLALKGGLRFTIYAVPPMALGISYLIFFISKIFNTFIYKETTLKIVKAGFISLATIAILYPNITHIIGYRVPTVFSRQEVSVLNKLKHIAGREDYVVTWWDYGYPIRYYSDVKTLIDGGKHTGQVDFPVSYALTHDQISAANIIRLDVEYTELGYKDKFNENLPQEMKHYGYKSINNFLQALKSKKFKLPKKTRNIFIYLPDRMMNIFPTINLFSNIDLSNGQELPNNFFYQTRRFASQGNILNLGRGIKIIKNKGEIQIGRQVLKINHFVVTLYNKKGELIRDIQTIDPKSPINVIYMKNYGRFIVLDKKMYNSMYIQLFVLQNYDKDLYKPVILNPLAKVYELKR